MVSLQQVPSSKSKDACEKLKSFLAELKMDRNLSLESLMQMATFSIACLEHSVIDYRVLAAVALITLAETQTGTRSTQALLDRILAFPNTTSIQQSVDSILLTQDASLLSLILVDSLGEESPSRALCLLTGFLSSGLETVDQLSAIHHMSILKSILEISENYSAIGIVSRLSALAFARWLQATLRPIWKETINRSKEHEFVIRSALEFIMIKWEDQCVPQNLLKEIFTNLVVTYGVRKSIIDTVREYPASRIKFEEARLLFLKGDDPTLVFQSLGGEKFLVQVFDSFSKPSLNGSATEVLKAFGKEYAKRGLAVEALFSHLVYSSLVSSDESSRKITAERILPSIAGSHSSVLNDIVGRLIKDWDCGRFESAQIYYEAFMNLFLAAKMNEFTLQIQVSQPLLYQNLLLDSVCSNSAILRYSTLAITTYSRQTVKDITTSELEIVKRYLTATSGGETAEMRQDILSLLSKFLDRLKNCVHKHKKIAQRLLDKVLKGENDVHRKELEKEANDLLSGCEEKIEFVRWLRQYSLSGLFPGAAIPRVLTSSSILQLISSKDFGYAGLECSKQDSRKLFWNLVRSFDKLDAFALIASEKEFCLEESMTGSLSSTKLIERSKMLLKSIRAKDLDTASTICKFLLIQDAQNRQKGKEEQNEGFRKLFQEYVTLLKNHIEECIQNMDSGAQNFPLNGILSALSHVVIELQSELVLSDEWRDALQELMGSCRRCCELASSIVSEPSPEKSLLGFTTSHNNPQVILRHSFRTIKEATNCLVQVVRKILLAANRNDDLFEWICSIAASVGDLFCHQLLTIRHKGAFMSVEESFGELCTLLASFQHQRLYTLLQRWLQTFLSQINSLEVSVTRRSAGLPTAIVTIIRSLSESFIKRKCFDETMATCFEIILQKNELQEKSERLDLARVHALNVLRLIMADSTLSSLTREYIGKCFEMCIALFSSPYFPIRNCAAMVFCTLVSKGFGTMKAKIESHQANLVFSHEFFIKFPTLYTVARNSLETSVATLAAKKIHPTLYPTLSILSHLKGSDSEYYDMKPFEELILECSAAPQWKVREVAASTLCGLVQPSSLLETIKKCIEKMAFANSNFTHGLALQIRALCDHHLPLLILSNSLDSHFPKIFASLLLSIEHVFTQAKYSVARGVLLELIFRLYMNNEFHLETDRLQADVIDNLLKLSCRVSFDVLAGQTSTIFCPSYDISTATKIILFTSPSKLVPLIEATDAFYNVSLLEAVWEHFEQVSSNIGELHDRLMQICSIVLDDIMLSPELVSISCKLALESESFVFSDKFEKSMTHWLSQPFITFSLIESMLQLCCKYLFRVVLSDEVATHSFVPPLWNYFVNRATASLDPASFPASLRLAIGVLLFETCCKFVPTNSTLFVDVAILIDDLVLDDDQEVRSQSVKVISYYMNTKVSATPTVARKAWGEFVLEKISSIECFSKWLDHHVERLTLTDSSAVKSVLNADTLFDAEPLNGFREHMFVSALSHDALKNLFSFSSVMPNDMYEAKKDRAKRVLAEHIDAIIRILEPWRDDLEWKAFCETDVFNSITEISYCASLLNLKLPIWIPDPCPNN